MRHPSPGFSLVELLVCVAVLAVILGLGVPALAQVRQGIVALNAFHALTASLNLARMTAISRGVAVSVCPSGDGRSCRSDLKWEDGWLVFLDPDRTGQPGQTGIVQVIGAVDAGLMVRSTAGRHRVRYQPSGLAGGNNLTLRLCRRKDARALGEVVVNLTGRSRTHRSGTPEPDCPFVP